MCACVCVWMGVCGWVCVGGLKEKFLQTKKNYKNFEVPFVTDIALNINFYKPKNVEGNLKKKKDHSSFYFLKEFLKQTSFFLNSLTKILYQKFFLYFY